MAPRWHPTNNKVAYLRGTARDVGIVNANGTSEALAASGLTLNGYADALWWVGSTDTLMVAETNFIHELLAFDTTQAPAVRSSTTGAQGTVFIPKITVTGGHNSNVMVVSRDGTRMVWRNQPNGGGTNSLTIRTALYSSLTGQDSSTFGTVVLTATNSGIGTRGMCLTPTGDKLVIAIPNGANYYDLWSYNSDGTGTPTQLTNEAGSNIHALNPDISPDGTRILYQRATATDSDLWQMNLDGSNKTNVTNTATTAEATPCYGPDGFHYVYSRLNGAQYDIYRDTLPDTVTQAPVLLAPADNVRITGPISVSFFLPENAQSGSVTLNFGGTTLTLAATEETMGVHNFTIDPTNPGTSPSVASVFNGPITDSNYAVSLVYTDSLGNPAASDTNTNITVDTITVTPLLQDPATNSSNATALQVFYALPDVGVLPGSVKLTFGPHVLTVSSLGELPGVWIPFVFNPANPTASPYVVSGPPIPDGTYSVTLSYQDDLGNPMASVTHTNVVVDTITTPPMFSAPAASTTYGTHVPVSFQLPETALPGSVKLSFGANELTLAGSQETAGSHNFTFPVNNPTSSAEIAFGSALSDGVYAVTLSYQDVLGNTAASVLHSAVEIDAVPNEPVFTTLHSKGGAVPNAGAPGSGIPSGALWMKLGIPSVNDAGHIAVLGDWKAGTVGGSGIFRGGPGNLVLTLAKGAPAPGLTNTVIGTLKDPLLGTDGSMAVVAALANAPSTTGAVTTLNNAAIALDPDGPGGAAAVIVARKGDAASGAGGATWKSFDSVALGSDAVAFLGKLAGSVTTVDDLGLWVYNRNTTTTTLALREGSALLGSSVKVISALVARAAAGGQGRGVENDGSQDQIAVRVTLADKRILVGAVADDGSLAWSYQSGGAAAGYVGAVWKGFGLPGQNTVTAQAFVGTAMGGNATTANNVAIFTEDDTTFALSRRLTKGAAAPGFPGGVFGGFKDPVLGSGGAFAFAGSTMVSSSAGIAASSNDGVWYHNGSTLSLIARESTHPVGTSTGSQWKAFTSVALPDGRRPLFYATLVVGPGGVSVASDTGIWATDSLGQVKKLIQEGDAFGSSTVKSFKALLAVAGSPTQTRSFNNNGEVVIQVTDAAGGTHLLHVDVP